MTAIYPSGFSMHTFAQACTHTRSPLFPDVWLPCFSRLPLGSKELEVNGIGILPQKEFDEDLEDKTENDKSG